MAVNPTYPGVYLQEKSSGSHTISGASTSVAAFVGYFSGGPVNKAVHVFSFAEFARQFGGLSSHSETSYAVRQFFLNGGGEAWVVRISSTTAPSKDWATSAQSTFAKTIVPTDADGKGIYALDEIAPATFNILCLPDGFWFTKGDSGSSSGDSSSSDGHSLAKDLYDEAAKFCEKHHAFLLVDLPKDLGKYDEVQSFADTVRHKHAATYYPNLDISDPQNDGKTRLTGTSGTLAGVYARTDANRGVWKAPAGTQAKLRGATPSVVVSDEHNGQFNDAGVNVLRSFAGYGPVSWGARTLVGTKDGGDSDNKYVPVRRLTSYLEQSLKAGLKWAVFEPNGEPLWATIRLTVESFLNRLYRQGAFKGETAHEAYFVACDSSTTTADDINRGIVNVVVGFAPYKPAEFVIVTLQQLAAQAQG